MSIDKETEMKTGMDMAALAEQRDDERQQAEAEAAQKMLQQMQNSAKDEPAKDNAAKAQAEEDEKRRAHEEAEAKRKAEWEEKQRKRKEAEQAAWENAVAMDDDQLLKASVKRLGDDAERVTRRNMKQCVTEYIQTHCYEDMDFARQVMHPRKTMIRCFRYINRKAKEFVKQEMEDNDEKPTADGYGCDVPDDLCYQWAVQYFMDMEAWIWKPPKIRRKMTRNLFRSRIPGSLLQSQRKKQRRKSRNPKRKRQKNRQRKISQIR